MLFMTKKHIIFWSIELKMRLSKIQKLKFFMVFAKKHFFDDLVPQK